MTKCEFCGKPLDDENTHYMNETTMCEDCLEKRPSSANTAAHAFGAVMPSVRTITPSATTVTNTTSFTAQIVVG